MSEEVRGHERKKRNYIKRKSSFWLGGKQEAAKEVVRISTAPLVAICDTEPQPVNPSEVNKMKIAELLILVNEKTGSHFQQRTRKQDLIGALLSPNLP